MAGRGDDGAFSAETAALTDIGIRRWDSGRGRRQADEGKDEEGRREEKGDKNKKARLECFPVEPPKNGSCLLSHLVGQYHRRWRA